jgi:glycosyltransferase involved in cell wall biosynthesis
VLWGCSFDATAMSGVVVEFLKTASVFRDRGCQIHLDLGYEVRSGRGPFFRPLADEAGLLPSWVQIDRVDGLSEVPGYNADFVAAVLREVVQAGDTRLVPRVETTADAISERIVKTWLNRGVGFVIVENGTLPENITYTRALRQAIEVYGRLQGLGTFVLWRDHDLMWQSEPGLRKYGEFPYVHVPPPVDSPFIHYVVQHDQALRRTREWAPWLSNVSVLPNTFTCRPAVVDEHNADFRRRHGIPDDAFLIARYTRVVPQKRIDRDLRLLAALDELVARPTCLFVAGDLAEAPDEYARLARLAASLGVAERVVFGGNLAPREPELPPSPDRGYSVRDLLAHADLACFLTSYDYESFGNPIGEAVASRVPYIATRYELYDAVYGDKGFRAPLLDLANGDLPAEPFVAAVAELVLDPARRDEIAAHNYRLATRHFDPRLVVELVDRVFARETASTGGAWEAAAWDPVPRPATEPAPRFAAEMAPQPAADPASRFAEPALQFAAEPASRPAAEPLVAGSRPVGAEAWGAVETWERAEPWRHVPMGDRVRLSVVLPVFNEADNLPATLASLHGQRDARGPMDHGLYEVVLVDNNSTDDTVAVARRFAAEHPDLAVHVISETEQGVSNARRTGMNFASVRSRRRHPAEPGDRFYLVSADADCRVDRTWLWELFTAMEASQAAIGVCDYYYDRAHFTDRPRLWSAIDRTLRCRAVTFGLFGGFPDGKGFAVDRDIHDKAGGIEIFYQVRDGRFVSHLSDDWDFGIRVRGLGGEIVYVPRSRVEINPRRVDHALDEVITGRAYGSGGTIVMRDIRPFETAVPRTDDLSVAEARQAWEYSIKDFTPKNTILPVLLTPSLLAEAAVVDFFTAPLADRLGRRIAEITRDMRMIDFTPIHSYKTPCYRLYLEFADEIFARLRATVGADIGHPPPLPPCLAGIPERRFGEFVRYYCEDRESGEAHDYFGNGGVF